MDKFNKHLNEQFKNAVHNINNRKVINYFNHLNIPEEELIELYKDYQPLCDSYYILFSFLPIEMNESYKTHLPSGGPVNEQNTQSVNKVYEKLTTIYKLADWLFIISGQNNVSAPYFKKTYVPFHKQEEIDLLLADIDNNINIIIKEMELAGYYMSYQYKYDSPKFNYVFVHFNPRQLDSITEFIRKNYSLLYHAAPVAVSKSIEENGFIPMSKSPKINYPPRVFFNVERLNWDSFDEMMRQVSYSHKDEWGYPNKYIIYTLDIDKIPEDIEFYADPNQIDCCYTTLKIPYDCVIKTMEHEY